MAETGARIDEVSLTVGWNRLRAVAEEVGTTIYRTAFSPLVRDSHDLAAALFDAQGRMVASADVGASGHINPMRSSVAHVLDKFGAAGLHPGDVVILNDPWVSTSQLLDITIVTPVFQAERLVGFVANANHYSDVGGLGIGHAGTDVFEEGLFIPALKLYREGRQDDALHELILANTRVPEMVAGDLDAAVGANAVGHRGLLRVLDDLRLDTLEGLAGEVLGRSEAAMREAIRGLSDGEYSAEVLLDGFESPVNLVVRIVVDGDDLLVDFAGTSGQSRRGINGTLPYTVGYAQYAVRLALSATLPNNSGTLSPIRVSAPEGSILNCRFPAPTMARHMVGQAIPNVILKALVAADPPACIAESCGANYGLTVRGRGDRALISSIYFVPGGMGAAKHHDGLTARHFPSSVRMLPIEVLEQDGLVRVLSRRRRPGSGGAGQFRGGDGLVVELELLEDGFVTGNGDRTLSPPGGAAGGKPGQTGLVAINGEATFPKFRLELNKGDVVRIETPGGGGWGSVPG